MKTNYKSKSLPHVLQQMIRLISLLWFVYVLCVVISSAKTSEVVLALLFLVVSLFLCLILSKVRLQDREKISICLGRLFFFAFIIIGVLLAYQLREYLVIDMKVIYDSVYSVLNGGEAGSYYIRCKNNFGMFLLSLLLHSVAQIFGIQMYSEGSINVMTFFNLSLIILTVFLLYNALKESASSDYAGLITLALSLLFFPNYLWAPLFYSDTASAPFPILCLLIFVKGTRSPNKKTNTLSWLSIGFIAMLGYYIKGNVLVMLIASLIFIILDDLTNKTKLIRLISLLLGALLCFALFSFIYTSCGLVDLTDKDRIAFPIETWFLFGSHGDGMFSTEDYEFVASFPDIDARTPAVRQKLIDNYMSLSVSEFVSFLSYKQTSLWGDGRYGADIFTVNAFGGSPLHTILLPSGYYYPYFETLTNAFQYFLLILFVFGLFLQYRSPSWDCIDYSSTSLLGTAVFLSFWELNSRYLYNFTPLLVLIAANTLFKITLHFSKTQNNH